MITFLAIALTAFAAARLVGWARITPRFPFIVITTAALLVAAYGLLSSLSPCEPAAFPLEFHDGEGRAVVVREERVVAAYANPAGLLFIAGALAAAALVFRKRRSATARAPRARYTWVVAATAIPYGATLIAAIASAPRGYDALWYHLPAALGFARSGHLGPPGRDLVFYFPANVELLARIAYDTVGARALGAIQWPFAVAAAWAAAALARRIGLGRNRALATALVLASPIVLFQSALGYADLVALACVACAAALLVAATRASSLRVGLLRAALGGLALGLLLGSKYAALPLVAALSPVYALYAFSPHGKLSRAQPGRALGLLAITAVAALAPSWFWFWRNLHLTGNPIFPIAVPSLHLPGLFTSNAFNPGKELEFVASRWHWIVYPWTERISHESGLGAAFACLVPGAFLVAVALLRRAARGRLPALGLPLGWGALYLAAWWWATPHEPRHLLPLLVLVGVPSLALLERRASFHAVRTALVAALAFSTVITTRMLAFSEVPELSARPRSYAALYDLPAALTNAIPDGARVCNRAGRPYNFALLGPHLTWSLWDFAPDWPSDADLAYHHIDYLVYRGPPRDLHASPRWRLIYQAATENQGWWEARDGDIIALYQISRVSPR